VVNTTPASLEKTKQNNKQAGVFEEVIDTFMLKITVSTVFPHTSFIENSSSKLLSGTQNSFCLVGGMESFLYHLVVRG
jgi:hypothetical protein